MPEQGRNQTYGHLNAIHMMLFQLNNAVGSVQAYFKTSKLNVVPLISM